MIFIYQYHNARLLNSGSIATHSYLISNCCSYSLVRIKIGQISSNYLKCASVSHKPFARTFPLLTRPFHLRRFNNIKSPNYLLSSSLHIQNKRVEDQDKTKSITTDEDGSSKEKVTCTKGPDSSSPIPPSSRETENNKEKNLSLVQKFKLMYKQYWYVLIPVHVATSLVWYGAFFFAAKSGVDIVPLLENMGATEKFLDYLRSTNAGYYGIAYAMYKIATPARYTVTIGGTTIAINYLKNRGYIKPVPTKEKLKEMYVDKREEFIERTEEMRERYHEKRNELIGKYHDKTDEMKEKYEEKKNEFLDKYNLTKRKPDDEQKR